MDKILGQEDEIGAIQSMDISEKEYKQHNITVRKPYIRTHDPILFHEETVYSSIAMNILQIQLSPIFTYKPPQMDGSYVKSFLYMSCKNKLIAAKEKTMCSANTQLENSSQNMTGTNQRQLNDLKLLTVTATSKDQDQDIQNQNSVGRKKKQGEINFMATEAFMQVTQQGASNITSTIVVHHNGAYVLLLSLS